MSIINKNRIYGHWIIKSLAVLFAYSLTAFNFSDIMLAVRETPSAYYAESEAELNSGLAAQGIPAGLSVCAVSSGDESLGSYNCRVEYRLLGLLPLKSVSAKIGQRAYAVPCGQAVGISIYTEGVLVVGLASFKCEDGRAVSPASEAGLKAGDLIINACGYGISTASELQSVIDQNTEGVELSVIRSGKTIELRVVPQLAFGAGAEAGYRIGAWIRDSTIGIGTLSYYDAETGTAAALGHAVVDVDTGTLLTVKDGKLVLAELIGVTKGAKGSPGELRGTFDSESPVIGTISGNKELGVYGSISVEALNYLPEEELPVAFPSEVHNGPAVLITSVDRDGAKRYSCRIVKTGAQNAPAQKGLVIEIDDPLLLEKTGGIVQGMSGSPILQDGKLVGVVTHVFVNDPQKGYGAYAYWMLKTLFDQA